MRLCLYRIGPAAPAAHMPVAAPAKAKRVEWQHRIQLMRGAAIDKDLLEEEARATLNRVGKNDLVIFYAQR